MTGILKTIADKRHPYLNMVIINVCLTEIIERN